VTVCFGQFFENNRNSQHFWKTFFTEKNILILAKNELGFVLGDFFTNASGHPEQKPHLKFDSVLKAVAN
jgi:hypothetical protein